MKDPKRLSRIQQEIWDSGCFLPTGDITRCNLAVLAVCQDYDCHAFDTPQGSEPMMADRMCDLLHTSGEFLIKPIGDCQQLVNEGALIIAAMNGHDLGQSHGHVVTLTPGDLDFSGHWNCKTPVCMNLGREGTCFRIKGVNYAFKAQPAFFAWTPSL